ncbi:uncharacterized protein RHO25_002588 [Cercospora beticola]|uniref:Uncharacterized protein n=1 Tax=Cercospora beticola TaxID=122368 RepID=A0ABZ0NEL8_CERBT|nr:hypothetical protein RHO25_002588 [Cercospora beticola]CAK1359181.1 unnamed protein product [Cercospora beticola]
MENHKPAFGPQETETIFNEKWVSKLKAYSSEVMRPVFMGSSDVEDKIFLSMRRGVQLVVDFRKEARVMESESDASMDNTIAKGLEQLVSGIEITINLHLRARCQEFKSKRPTRQVLDQMAEIANFMKEAQTEGLWNSNT